MKNIIGIIIVCIIISGVFLFFVWSLNNLFNNFADIQKCQRLTDKRFFECGQMSQEDINNLEVKNQTNQ